MPDVVAQHRLAPTGSIILVVAVDRLDTLPPEATITSAVSSDAAIVVLARKPAYAWLGAQHDVSKWDSPDPEAMDVAVVAAGGATVMRLTAR